jgi:quercetin dioxygenase-like cupin family protein
VGPQRRPRLGLHLRRRGGAVPQLGYTIAVLEPGQSGGRYHREANQEDFLVLAGECLVIIEGEERHLKAWDFVHCPAHTEHGFVGGG